MPTDFEAALLADHVYGRTQQVPIGPAWQIQPFSDPQTGNPVTNGDGFFKFQSLGAALYRKGNSNEFVIAFHGLDGIGDLFLDVLNSATGNLFPQFFTALNFV